MRQDQGDFGGILGIEELKEGVRLKGGVAEFGPRCLTVLSHYWLPDEYRSATHLLLKLPAPGSGIRQQGIVISNHPLDARGQAAAGADSGFADREGAAGLPTPVLTPPIR
jgi:hypothetical protein